MKLKEFIDSYVNHNSIIRLLYKTKTGHETVLEGWSHVSMAHEVSNHKGIYSKFVNKEVLYVISIYSEYYLDAINIVIKK